MPRQRLTGAVLEAIDLAYSAADGEAAWPQFLAATAELVGADNAYLSHIDHRRLELECEVLDGGRWDPVALERYRQMIPVDALMPALHSRLLSPVMCSEVVAPAVRETSPQYREIFPALEIKHSLATALEKSETTGIYLGLTRSSRTWPDRSQRPHLHEAGTRANRGAASRRTYSQADTACQPVAVDEPQRQRRLTRGHDDKGVTAESAIAACRGGGVRL